MYTFSLIMKHFPLPFLQLFQQLFKQLFWHNPTNSMKNLLLTSEKNLCTFKPYINKNVIKTVKDKHRRKNAQPVSIEEEKIINKKHIF